MKEYLLDYASADTRKVGDEMIIKELEKIPNEKARKIAKENIEKIANGERDFRF